MTRQTVVTAALIALLATAASCGPVVVYPDTATQPAAFPTEPRATVAPPAPPPPTSAAQLLPPASTDEHPPPADDPTRASDTVPPAMAPAAASLADLLAGVIIAPEAAHDAYRRDAWTHWNGGLDPHDGLNTRHEVLASQSTCPPVIASGAVRSGCWNSPYDGSRTHSPGDLHIDHVVALAEAHQSGGHTWDADQRERYANDPYGLIAVSAASNMAKSAHDPPTWMPTSDAAHCGYLIAWTAVKLQWALTMDSAEHAYIAERAPECDASTSLHGLAAQP